MSRAPSIIEKGLDAKRVKEAACTLGLDRRVRGEVLAMLRNLKSVGLACSGGVDSVAALAWAWAFFPEIRWTVLHYDHAVRGEASTQDAEFVLDLARSLKTDAVVNRWSEPEKRASEARLREKRFDFFKKAVSERGLGAIVTGHHAEDVVETFLMRSLRGVGAEGLSAPRPDSRGPGGLRFLRPFLSIEKDLLRQFLETLGLGWREDASNERPQYLRNVVRKELLPKFYEVSNTAGRDGRKMLTRTRDALQRDAEIVEWAICEALQSARLSCPDALSLNVLRSLPRGLARCVLERWLREMGVLGESSEVLDVLSDSVVRGELGIFTLGKDWQVKVEDAVRIQVHAEPVERLSLEIPLTRLVEGVDHYLPGHSILRADAVEVDSSLRERLSRGEVDPQREAWVDLSESSGKTCYLRFRLPGDRYHPMGAPGSKKLKDILGQRKISLSERIFLPIVSNVANSIIWVPGLPPSEEARIRESTNVALRLTYRIL